MTSGTDIIRIWIKII